MTTGDPREPAWVERVPFFLHGQPTTRLILIFRAIGCAWARRADGGCAMCGFQAMTTKGVPVSDEDLIAQFESVVAPPGALDGVGEVDLYNSGSFFADQEISPRVREHVLRRLAKTDVKLVLLEARAEHVMPAKLAAARAAIGDKELEVGIGLESADDRVREVLVNKGYGKAEFESAVAALRGSARLLTYLLIKPMGLSEREALEDAVSSARYVFEVAGRNGVAARAAFQPVFVPPGTALEKDFLAGRYRPPSLWTVIEVVRRTHAMGEVIVGMSEEGLGPHMGPEGCDHCTPKLKAALVDYNRTHDLGVFAGLECGCREAVADRA